MKAWFLILFSSLLCSFIYAQDKQVTQPFYLEIGVDSDIEVPPYFPGCEDILDLIEKRKCSEKKMSFYVNTRIKYPANAREKGTSGIVKAQFKINQIGTIEDVSIIEDIGDGCGQAVKNAILTMKDLESNWSPAYHKGYTVDVYYIIPVSFNLEGSKKRRQ